MERMSKTMAEGKEDLERAFNIMNEELLKAEYKARVDYYGKSMDEIMEEVAKETKSYKRLEEENKKLKSDLMQDMKEITELEIENKNLNKKIDKLIQKIDQLEEENENLRKDLFHLTNNGKAK